MMRSICLKWFSDIRDIPDGFQVFGEPLLNSERTSAVNLVKPPQRERMPGHVEILFENSGHSRNFICG